MASAKRVALYARVSTSDQTTENQIPPLRAWAEQQGYVIVGEFIDEGISGTKGRESRAGLDRMLRAATHGEVDMIAVVSLDRLGRSLLHLVKLVEDLKALGVDLFVRNMALDTSTPTGKLCFYMFSALAEFERALLIERTRAGLDRARRQGKRIGRPPVKPYIEGRARDLLRAGNSLNETVRMTGLSRWTVQRIKREMHAA